MRPAAAGLQGDGPDGGADGDPVLENLEEMFADRRQAPAVLLLGIRGSGKSNTALRMIRWALESGAIDKLIAILPVYKYESSGSYSWMREKDMVERVMVTEEYSPSLIQAILNRKIDENSSRLLLFIDDLAAAAGKMLWEDNGFTKLLSVTRHVRCSIVLCHHACSGGYMLPGFIRQNASHIFLLRISNRKLLQQTYEEWMSLVPEEWASNLNRFVAAFTEHTSAGGPGSGLCIDLARSEVSWRIKEWWPEFRPDQAPASSAKNDEAEPDSPPRGRKRSRSRSPSPPRGLGPVARVTR